jgi:hypothetical protein
MPVSRSVVSVLLRALGDFSLHPQGRPCGRPPAALRPGNDTTVPGRSASPSAYVPSFVAGHYLLAPEGLASPTTRLLWRYCKHERAAARHRYTT